MAKELYGVVAFFVVHPFKSLMDKCCNVGGRDHDNGCVMRNDVCSFCDS